MSWGDNIPVDFRLLSMSSLQAENVEVFAESDRKCPFEAAGGYFGYVNTFGEGVKIAEPGALISFIYRPP